LSVDVTSHFKGAVRGQSGHLVIRTSPYGGHERREDVAKLDIDRMRCCASSPEKKKKRDGRMARAVAGWLGLDDGSSSALPQRDMDKLWVPRYEVDMRWVPCAEGYLWVQC
jgi:hypothetical protein